MHHFDDQLWLDQLRPNRRDHLAARRKDAKRGQGPAVEYWFAIDQHLEMAVGSTHHLDFRVELAPQFRRHTDSVPPSHSVRTGLDFDSSHGSSFYR